MKAPSRQRFPQTDVAIWSAFRHYTVPGLFAFRVSQAMDFLNFPNITGDPQAEEILARHAECRPPLTAVAVFLSVVALEDFLREFGKGLHGIEGFSEYFPKSTKLAQKVKSNTTGQRRREIDATELLNPGKVNRLYGEVFKVSPFDEADIPKLHDLILVRHIVAHHGAIVKDIDAKRFGFYDIPPGLLNPQAQFVKELCIYVYNVGRVFERSVSEVIFKKVKEDHPLDWKQREVTRNLIEFFNLFGKFFTGSVATVSSTGGSQAQEPRLAYTTLFEQCLADIEQDSY